MKHRKLNIAFICSQGQTIPSLSGTFSIPTRLAHNPKMPKEPSSPSRSNSRIKRCLCIEGVEGQRTTRNKKHWAASAKFERFNIS